MTKNKKILVVEDDIDQLDHISMILKADGYDVIKAQGQVAGEEALLTAIPDLAILDLMMENMDSGFVLCHQIKHLYPDTPVILLTAVKSETGVDFSAKSKGAASWIKADVMLDKPIRPEQLRIEVQRLMA
jgi:CheY-like chemotaxis protein